MFTIDNFETSDIVVKSAAVGDYRAKNIAEHKIKKHSDWLFLSCTSIAELLT